MSDGLFDLSGEAVRILAAPDMTHVIIAALIKIAGQVVADEISPQEAVAQFTEIHSGFGDVARRAWEKGKTALMLIAAVAGIAGPLIGYRQIRLAEKQNALSIADIDDQAAQLQRLESYHREVLRRLSDIAFVLEDDEEQKAPSRGEKAAANPAEGKAGAKPSTRELRSDTTKPQPRLVAIRDHRGTADDRT